MSKGAQTAVIVGAGIGGLAIANLLAKNGWQVDIYEKQSHAGGRAGEFTLGGFRFDTGPSWYLMPEVFEHYFALLGEEIGDHLELTRLDPAYKVFYDYHKPLTVYANVSTDAKMFDSVESGAGMALKRYVAQAGRTYQVALKEILYNPFQRPRNFLSLALLRQLPFVLTQLLRPLHGYVQKYVTSLPLQQILEYPMVFLGTSPFRAPALFHLMSHLDFTQGVFYPRGGMYKIIRSLERLAIKNGVRIHYDAPVSKIKVNAKTAEGVVVKGRLKRADIVISNADLKYTETQLLPELAQSYPERYWKRKVAGPSALLMYLGVSGKLPDLKHHNLVFTAEWQQNFQAIFGTKYWPKNASMYVSKTSETDPTSAPKNHENIFVLVPLPANSAVDDVKLQAMANWYIKRIAEITGIPDLPERIVEKHIYGPNNFEEDFNAWHGTALGMSHLLTQSAFFRPGSKSKKLNNLFYVGAGVQPGIGLPMCLISAELLYKRLIGDTSNGPLDAPTTSFND